MTRDPLRWDLPILLLVVAGVAGGAVAHVAGHPTAATALWWVTTLGAAIVLGVSVSASLIRREPGVDVIALLALLAALWLREDLAGAVIAVMYAGGRALESHARSRARKELSALLGRAPRVAHRYEDGELRAVPLDRISPGDLLLVRPGDVVPVDGMAAGGGAVLDASALTGESVPVEVAEGGVIRSGAVNAGGPFDLRATADAASSSYAGIVRLVREAEESRAPSVRLADRYAFFFIPLTLLIAGIAWGVSGDPVRGLAVLVVATPCPLILAVPVAILSGVSRAARRGIIVKGGGPLEVLARASVLVLDKTGTITTGAMSLSEVMAFSARGPDEVLRLAASLDQMSRHPLASAIVTSARARGLRLSLPSSVHEEMGRGIRGIVEDREVAVGSWDWAHPGASSSPEAARVRRRTAVEGSTSVVVSIDGALSGALILHDAIRGDSARTVRSLRRAGFSRVVLLSGDHRHVAEAIGAGIGADEVLAERSPEEKVLAVRAETARGVTVMVGDGVNDAAALAAADAGVAVGPASSASSQAADVVLAVNRIDRLGDAIRIARRSRRIAGQSALAGMGLSGVAMGFAAGGWLTPVAGALLQEAIDVLVILNALRALGAGAGERRAAGDLPLDRCVLEEHRDLQPGVERLRATADRLDTLSPGAARAELDAIRSFLEEVIVPHEKRDEAVLYPIVADLIGGDDPTGAMSRAHAEIAHLTRLYGRLLDELPGDALGGEDLRDLRRLLYGLHAVLRLHFAQEDEHYLSLLPEPPGSERAGAPR